MMSDDSAAAAAEGMLQWKQGVLASVSAEVYSDEWWQAMIDSLVFVPEEQRAMMIAGLTGIGVAF
jgi:hypothetical protein